MNNELQTIRILLEYLQGPIWFSNVETGEHVSGLKGNRHIPDGKKIFGVYKGVRVGVIRTNGKIAIVFPDANQNKRR